MKDKKRRNEALWGLGMVAPTIIGLIVLNIIPILQTLKMSFFKSGDFGRGDIFVGLANYQKMFADEQVRLATWNTLKYTLLVVPITVVLATVLATLLNSNIKGKHIYRTLYFLPMVAAPAAVTMVWKWLYNTDFGLINYILGKGGLGPVNWIEDPKIAIFSIAAVGIWSTVGYSMILILAGLQEIPTDFYEAARIDGASQVRQFFAITLPMVSPTLFFVVVTSIIQAMQVFDSIYMMEGVTSPAYKNTVSLVYLFYNNSFKYSDKGYGSTIVMLLLVIIMIITVIQMKIQKKWVHYN
ncbi:UNVERIFIED_CONTAM: sugar ABC transporter permease [Streptococcus canis]|uniref:Lactose transport system permease protein LacF n=2 Tax=Streptococcus canis TaxID=1329 RepID=A0A2D4DMM9_STRCB|nr:sugar ABC transporter permease [Streptococcus canis]EIQ81041.1 ABC-type sugar transport system, permease component [Streptococcus canis FSL Z3-227]MDV5972561.1 sugar ABC transporter permease [Streptococcus canis]MDV5976608.1 sugar ABC transporter permease [Streptococcus canis]MDV5987535.1 sugar ABC transporter permease [Streptococcus canis]MDV5993408.1 sugar ABC transporter permease [Streptococcus canis]